MVTEREWDGVCACGKAEMDGKRCKLGASHVGLARTESDDLDFLDETATEDDDLDFLN
jgi:hypothetical protein